MRPALMSPPKHVRFHQAAATRLPPLNADSHVAPVLRVGAALEDDTGSFVNSLGLVALSSFVVMAAASALRRAKAFRPDRRP
jgi:hypothetical protein